MGDPVERLAALREHTARPLSDGDVDGLIARAQRRRRVRRAQRAAVAGVLCLVGAGAAVWRLRPADTALRFADGSTAQLVGDGSELSVTESSAARTVVAVRRGAGRFEVTRNPARLFRVVAGEVTVDVIGTRFVVERGDEVRVRVERGHVRVTSPRGTADLVEGDERTFLAISLDKNPAPTLDEKPVLEPEPVPVPDPKPAAPAPSPPQRATPPSRPSPPPKPARPAWRDSADRRDFPTAYDQLRKAGLDSVRDLPEELLEAADVARWSGHPAEAVPLLERVTRDHARDPRAQLAAFTLGRVLLEELKRPSDAASAFAKARALAPRGPLAEDALFREAQCWSRAGNGKAAAERARLYLATYPEGSHRRAIARLGGLEP